MKEPAFPATRVPSRSDRSETMPDRYDPKLSVRPAGERKAADPSSDPDPLAELARIVSGRTPFDPPPSAKGKAVPAPPPPEPDVERDLEAELLNDLQASFAAIREPLENAGAAVPAAGAAVPAARIAAPRAEPPPRAAAPSPSRRRSAPRRSPSTSARPSRKASSPAAEGPAP